MALVQIGIFKNLAEGDREISTRTDAFLFGLNQANVQIHQRFGGGVRSRYPKIAHEIVTYNPAPQAILATCWPTMDALRFETRLMLNQPPIIFAGLVNASGAPNYQYRNNITGIVSHEMDFCPTWLIKLKALMGATLQRVGVIYDADPAHGTALAQFNQIVAAAPGQGISANNVIPIDARYSDSVFEDAVKAFADTPNGGLIVPTGTLSATRRNLIIDLAATYQLPAIYPHRMYPFNGGLISYGPKLIDQYRAAGGIVNSILNGTPVTSIPPQINRTVDAANFELVINLKAANAINLPGLAGVLAQADRILS